MYMTKSVFDEYYLLTFTYLIDCTMINSALKSVFYHHTYQPGGHNIIHATSLFTQQLTTQNVISDSLVIYIR